MAHDDPPILCPLTTDLGDWHHCSWKILVGQGQELNPRCSIWDSRAAITPACKKGTWTGPLAKESKNCLQPAHIAHILNMFRRRQAPITSPLIQPVKYFIRLYIISNPNPKYIKSQTGSYYVKMYFSDICSSLELFIYLFNNIINIFYMPESILGHQFSIFF